MNLRERIKSIQERDKFTDTEVSKRLGIHRTTWNRIKNGKSEPDKETLRKLARIYPELGLDILKYVIEDKSEVAK